MHRHLPAPAAAVGLALVLAACAAGTASSPTESDAVAPMESMPMGSTPMDSDDHEFAWGEPAEPEDADRVVEIQMLDELRFDPSEVEVRAGETVTFQVTNAGQLPHDFTLGDEATQAEHEAEMAESGMAAHGEPNVLTLQSGEQGELTWRFTNPGSILYGCHVPGHYEAGMVGTLTTSAP